jgi:glutamate synthase (NADPH/NADH) large chain
MSGGIAFVYDPTELFDTKCNLDMVDLETVWRQEDEKLLKKLIQQHFKYTGSIRARRILDNWEAHMPLFVKVMPIDYKQVLERMALKEDTDKDTVSATEEVYN